MVGGDIGYVLVKPNSGHYNELRFAERGLEKMGRWNVEQTATSSLYLAYRPFRKLRNYGIDVALESTSVLNQQIGLVRDTRRY